MNFSKDYDKESACGSSKQYTQMPKLSFVPNHRGFFSLISGVCGKSKHTDLCGIFISIFVYLYQLTCSRNYYLLFLSHLQHAKCFEM